MGRRRSFRGKYGVLLVLLLASGLLLVGIKGGTALWNLLWSGGRGEVKITRLPEPEIPAPPLKAEPPRVAIIIDDLGGSFRPAQAFMDLGHPLTLSILPQLTFSKKIAEEAHRRGYEVLLHLPLEPYDYPEKNPGKGAILAKMSFLEVKQRFLEDLESVPYAVGLNNHMGSKLTEDAEVMKAILEEAKRRNLFFIDSLTTGRSIALGVARELGLPSEGRQVFLDNVAEKEYIKSQILLLAEAAKDRGSAIGIAHPHKATIEALREAIPEIQGQGVKLVLASELVK